MMAQGWKNSSGQNWQIFMEKNRRLEFLFLAEVLRWILMDTALLNSCGHFQLVNSSGHFFDSTIRVVILPSKYFLT